MSYDIQSVLTHGMAGLVERLLKSRVGCGQGLDRSRTTVGAMLLPAFVLLSVLKLKIHLEN